MPKFTAFNKHRATDTSDPGFTIPSIKLRWINGRVSENNPGRPWAILRKSDLPKELIEYLEGMNPDVFKGGETIRRGDLVLGYASNEANAKLKGELRQAAADLQKQVRLAPAIANKAGKSRSEVLHNEDSDVTQDMIEQFKHARK